MSDDWKAMQRYLFADVTPTPTEHFKRFFYAAILHVIDQVFAAAETTETALEQYPFLAGYLHEVALHGLDGLSMDIGQALWRESLQTWEASSEGHLPLRALAQAAGLDYHALTLLLTIGLVDEDARWGALFEDAQGLPGQRRPTLGLLAAWWAEQLEDPRARLREWIEGGLVTALNPDAPRGEWALTIPPPIWDALRGETTLTLRSGLRYDPPHVAPGLTELVLPPAAEEVFATLPLLLAAGEIQAVVVRGPRHNGRRTALRALARALGQGVLVVEPAPAQRGPDADQWRLVGPLALLLHALPVVVLDPLPGETVALPQLTLYEGPLGVILGPQGSVTGPAVERLLTVTLPLPPLETRRRLWQGVFADDRMALSPALSERYRLTSGHIHRAATLARAHAALDSRLEVTLADVGAATAALGRQELDTLAIQLPRLGNWDDLAVDEETRGELRTLESRCRYRERLGQVVGPAVGVQLTAGVRALFSGPSGTGKTLAARLLASALDKDIYRLDLATVVNKFIGETEKNLAQVFAHAEALDILLLIDEGDALLTHRTQVQTSNDRYANLETNYLLQRLETFEGILIVTTNAADRIDGAFQRRMDVVIDFRAPDAAERWAIWRLHLPPTHAVPAAYLQEVAARCQMTGGQIRNAALHAGLLALQNGGTVTGAYLDSAIRREYRKSGGVCPLRPVSG